MKRIQGKLAHTLLAAAATFTASTFVQADDVSNDPVKLSAQEQLYQAMDQRSDEALKKADEKCRKDAQKRAGEGLTGDERIAVCEDVAVPVHLKGKKRNWPYFRVSGGEVAIQSSYTDLGAPGCQLTTKGTIDCPRTKEISVVADVWERTEAQARSESEVRVIPVDREPQKVEQVGTFECPAGQHVAFRPDKEEDLTCSLTLERNQYYQNSDEKTFFECTDYTQRQIDQMEYPEPLKEDQERAARTLNDFNCVDPRGKVPQGLKAVSQDKMAYLCAAPGYLLRPEPKTFHATCVLNPLKK